MGSRLFDNEVDDSGPGKPRGAVRPSAKVHVVTAFQFRSVEFLSLALVLHSQLACPANHERTPWSSHETRMLSRGLQGIETISGSEVTAMPTSADCGVFASPIVDSTPSVCFEMKR